jgi:hypothetical protein
VAIRITKADSGYEAELSPPHGGGTIWRTSGPLGRDALIAVLRDRGCHQTDIGDAFVQADPEWLMRQDP